MSDSIFERERLRERELARHDAEKELLERSNTNTPDGLANYNRELTRIYRNLERKERNERP